MNETTLNEGIEVWAAPRCYLTGETGEVVYTGLRDTLFGAPGSWNIRKSPSLDFYWLDPRPNEDQLGKLYADYYTHQPLSLSLDRGLRPLKRRLARLVLSALRQYPGTATERRLGRLLSFIPGMRSFADTHVLWLPGPTGKLLDVGCGSGRFLKQMERHGWVGQGVEFDQAGVEAARKIGLEVYHGKVEAGGFPQASFETVSLNHVIEHLTDPVATLKTLHGLLAPGGRLLIVTPNVASLGHSIFREHWRGLEIPRHLFLFSPRSLIKTVERAGFQVKSSRTLSRTARGIWRESSEIAARGGTAENDTPRNPAAGNGNPPHRSKGKLGGRLFSLWESARCLFSPVGEELLVIAEKPQD